MKDASSEQRLLERIHSLEKSLNGFAVKLGYMADDIAEMHKDVKGLLGFRANLLGWAAGISGAISLCITLALAWVFRR